MRMRIVVCFLYTFDLPQVASPWPMLGDLAAAPESHTMQVEAQNLVLDPIPVLNPDGTIALRPENAIPRFPLRTVPTGYR
ncbi:hypothetical protein GCM10027343_22150 [Noviherbaspirillum agri]